jgi:hypothetical protein
LLEFQFHLIDGNVLVGELVLQFFIEHDDLILLLDGIEVLSFLAQRLQQFCEFVDVLEGDVVLLLLENERF